MTVDKFIKFLQDMKKSGQLTGKEKVMLSCDEEGNSFASFEGGDYSIGIENGHLVLYPTGKQVLAEEIF